MFFCTVLCLATEKTKGQKENQADDFNSSAQRIPHCGLPIGISLFQLCSFTFSATKWTLTIFFFLIFFLLHLLLLFSLKEMGKCSNRAFWLNQWAHTSKPAGTSNPYRWIHKKNIDYSDENMSNASSAVSPENILTASETKYETFLYSTNEQQPNDFLLRRGGGESSSRALDLNCWQKPKASNIHDFDL